ncbi:hypothetical protein [Kribbella deserti]|uniref:DUF5667 domain-containing protein n=1 Tax=Kribbella deserti TaxID=1926257 RepID=A0ABV6QW11_9ACTN
MAESFDLDAIAADDALLDLLAAGGGAAFEALEAGGSDPAVLLLADLRLAVEVEDELPVEHIEDAETFLARCAALNPVSDPLARKIATRTLALGVAAVAALSVSGVAAAVTGDPLSPYEKVIEKVVQGFLPEISFPAEDLEGLPVTNKVRINKVAKDYKAKRAEEQRRERERTNEDGHEESAIDVLTPSKVSNRIPPLLGEEDINDKTTGDKTTGDNTVKPPLVDKTEPVVPKPEQTVKPSAKPSAKPTAVPPPVTETTPPVTETTPTPTPTPPPTTETSPTPPPTTETSPTPQTSVPPIQTGDNGETGQPGTSVPSTAPTQNKPTGKPTDQPNGQVGEGNNGQTGNGETGGQTGNGETGGQTGDGDTGNGETGGDNGSGNGDNGSGDDNTGDKGSGEQGGDKDPAGQDGSGTDLGGELTGLVDGLPIIGNNGHHNANGGGKGHGKGGAGAAHRSAEAKTGGFTPAVLRQFLAMLNGVMVTR